MAAALGLGAPVAYAQDEEAGPATRAQLTRQLNEQVNILARNPYDFRALFEAARIALGLGDISAAEGFYRRAEERAPGDYRIKQGLAAVALRRGQPRVAMALFEEAEELGAPEDSAASERGLALDLLGDQKGAQKLYRKAIENEEGDEAVRRLALSLAITGDARESERTLRPLMSRRDRAAYRTRAFALASMGRTDDAVTVAEAMLPAAQAARMEPYLRYVPRLSPAQKVAAGSLGLFPRVANLGTASRGVSAAAPSAADQRSEGSRLVPAGEPLGNTVPPRQMAENNAQPAEVAATVQSVEPAQTGEEAQSAGDASPDPAEERPGFDLAALPASTSAQAAPGPAAPGPAAAGEKPVELTEAFAGFTLPSVGDGPAPGAGAVDLSSFEPPREKPKPKVDTAKLEKEHPRRFWVQVATGRDRGALAFDWRRIRRASGDLLGEYDGHLAAWNATNRLLAGPYRSEKVAQDIVTQLKGKGVDSFSFTSDAGEDVTPLGSR